MIAKDRRKTTDAKYTDLFLACGQHFCKRLTEIVSVKRKTSTYQSIYISCVNNEYAYRGCSICTTGPRRVLDDHCVLHTASTITIACVVCQNKTTMFLHYWRRLLNENNSPFARRRRHDMPNIGVGVQGTYRLFSCHKKIEVLKISPATGRVNIEHSAFQFWIRVSVRNPSDVLERLRPTARVSFDHEFVRRAERARLTDPGADDRPTLFYCSIANYCKRRGWQVDARISWRNLQRFVVHKSSSRCDRFGWTGSRIRFVFWLAS